MTAQVIQLFTPRRIADHEAQINRDKWAARDADADWIDIYDDEADDHEAQADAAEQRAWRIAGRCLAVGWAVIAAAVFWRISMGAV